MNDARHRNVPANGGVGRLEECSDLCSLLQRPQSAVRHAITPFQY